MSKASTPRLPTAVRIPREEREVDSRSNGGMARIVRVEVVTTVEGAEEPGRVSRIPRCSVLIKYAIAAALTPADVRIHSATRDLARRAPVGGCPVWR